MRQLVTGLDVEIAEWVRLQCPGVHDWGQCTAIGLADENKLIAGVVFNRFHRGLSIDISVAATPGKQWLSRSFLHDVFVYPFRQLNLNKVQSFIPASNRRSERLCVGLGFTLEGRLREAWPGGEDLLVYGMLARECRWIKGH